MKKNILTIDKEWDEIIHHDAITNEDGEVIQDAYDETIHRQSMKAINVEMTEDEEQEMLSNVPQEQQESKEDLLAQMQELMNRYKALEN